MLEITVNTIIIETIKCGLKSITIVVNSELKLIWTPSLPACHSCSHKFTVSLFSVLVLFPVVDCSLKFVILILLYRFSVQFLDREMREFMCVVLLLKYQFVSELWV